VEVSARRYRNTGKERDDETGLYYHGARYYAAWLGRWTSADPLGIGADGPGLYNYTRGSPVVLVDPSGLEGATPPLAPRVGLPSPPPPKAELEKAAPAKSARTTGPRPANSSPAPTASATASSGGAASVLGNVLSGAAEEVSQKARDLAKGVIEHPLQALQSATPLGAGAALITGAISSSTRIAETAMASATVASGDESQRQFGKLLVNLVELALTVAPFVKGGKTGKGSSSDPLGIADDIKVDLGTDPDFGLKPRFDPPEVPAASSVGTGSRKGPGSGLTNQTREQLLSSQKTYEGLLAEHQKKLADYTADPMSQDNKGLLRNAPSEQVRRQIIAGRTKVLEDQIIKHQGELAKIKKLLGD
jgi:RHS repeat-associated protein